MDHNIIIHNDIPITSSVNARAKRLSLRVDSKVGIIRLTIPKWTMKRSINRFLDNNQDWIADRYKHLLPKVHIKDGSIIPFLGQDYIIKIIPSEKRATRIYANNQNLVIETSREDPTSNLKRWFIEQAKEHIIPLAQQKARMLGKEISKIDFRDPTSRWGSCSTDKRLMFSWRIIMAPVHAIDYLVAHEVAHLKHMDHSKRFWDTCYDLCADETDGQNWLKTNGNTLMRYF